MKTTTNATSGTPRLLAFAALALAALVAPPQSVSAQSAPPGFAEEFLGQFESSARKLVALAEAMPAEKFDWRPGEGVASVVEVYMHIAHYNYMYPEENLGIAAPASAAGHGAWEGTVTDKDEAVRILSASMDHVRKVAAGMGSADMEKATRLYGRDVAQWAVLLQLVAHMNEHLGQSIAYSRMNGVAPPWAR